MPRIRLHRPPLSRDEGGGNNNISGLVPERGWLPYGTNYHRFSFFDTTLLSPFFPTHFIFLPFTIYFITRPTHTAPLLYFANFPLLSPFCISRHSCIFIIWFFQSPFNHLNSYTLTFPSSYLLFNLFFHFLSFLSFFHIDFLSCFIYHFISLLS